MKKFLGVLFILGFFCIFLFAMGLVLSSSQNNNSANENLQTNPIFLNDKSNQRFYYNPEQKVGFFYPDTWRVKVLSPTKSNEPFIEIFQTVGEPNQKIKQVQLPNLNYCNNCPQFHPTAPDWCLNGEIVQGNYTLDAENNCFCTGEAECLLSSQ